jgi:hypothetical protein
VAHSSILCLSGVTGAGLTIHPENQLAENFRQIAKMELAAQISLLVERQKSGDPLQLLA